MMQAPPPPTAFRSPTSTFSPAPTPSCTPPRPRTTSPAFLSRVLRTAPGPHPRPEVVAGARAGPLRQRRVGAARPRLAIGRVCGRARRHIERNRLQKTLMDVAEFTLEADGGEQAPA